MNERLFADKRCVYTVLKTFPVARKTPKHDVKCIFQMTSRPSLLPPCKTPTHVFLGTQRQPSIFNFKKGFRSSCLVGVVRELKTSISAANIAIIAFGATSSNHYKLLALMMVIFCQYDHCQRSRLQRPQVAVCGCNGCVSLYYPSEQVCSLMYPQLVLGAHGNSRGLPRCLLCCG